MKPVFLLVASFPDSLIKFRGSLIGALQGEGMEVHVAAPDLVEDDAVHRALTARGVTAHSIGLNRAGLNPIADLNSVFELYRLMKVVRPCWVLAYTIKPVIYGLLAAWLARAPRRFALITGLGYAFQPGGKRDRLRILVRWLYRFVLGRVDKVFFQNPDDEALFRQLGILPPEVLSCIVNGSGVDVTEYKRAPLPDTPRFLLIARLLGDKGVREYAQAAARVKACHPQALFQLAGWIDDNPDAISQQELNEWVNSGTLDYLGKLADVRPAIAGCRVYVLPSYREGTPRTALEAMAMGRAVITTNAPGCRETVTHGNNGYLVSVKAVDELVEAMLCFIEKPELAEWMGQRSREITEQKYDVRKVNDHMIMEMGIRQ